MTPRMTDHFDRARTGYRALTGFEAALQAGPLEPKLLHLVKLRASQINGCAFCLEMHTREARAAGETEARLYLLNAWRESPLYTARERAALEWVEAVTLVSVEHVPDAAWKAVQAEFTDKEIVDLTVAIGMINVWNRLAVSFRLAHPVQQETRRKLA